LHTDALKRSCAVLLIAAVVMALFSFGVSAHPPNDGGYVVGNVNDYAYDGQITVTVLVESRPYSLTDSSSIYHYEDVTLGTSAGTNQISYVSDALYTVSANAANNISMYTNEAATNPIAPNSSFVAAVKEGSKKYSSLWMMDGWCFRLNGKIPLIDWISGPPTGSPSGAAINQTPLSDGDVIHFYYDNPNIMYDATYQPSFYAKVDFVYPEVNYNALTGNVLVKAKKNTHFFDASFNWTINAFSSYLAGKNVYIYDSNASLVTQGTLNPSNGQVTLNTGTLSSGKYYVKVGSAGTQIVNGLNLYTFQMENFELPKTTSGFNTFIVP
jgi:hypothetical protein